METTVIREISLRYKSKKKVKLEMISSPENAAKILRKLFPDNVKEHFVVLYLDSAHQIIGYSVVFTGTANACLIGNREIFQTAILIGAIAILAAHNHPSGSTIPSEEDRKVTSRLKEAGAILGVKVLDHQIITDNSFYSFSENSSLLD